MADDIRRISIGLIGMQVLELRVTDSAYQELRSALEGDNPGWHTVPTQDSEVLVDLEIWTDNDSGQVMAPGTATVALPAGALPKGA